MLFGQQVEFSDVSGAMTEWLNIAEEIETVQYMEGQRGRGRKRRKITSTVKLFIARAKRYKDMATDQKDIDDWADLCATVEKQYNSMLETKSVLNQELDNVW